MKLIWLEDFLALIDAGTFFSKAAALRNVTQPAFSRRIQMLEDWLEVELVDRRSQRLQLTTTAARFEPEICALVSRIYELKSNMVAAADARQKIVLTTQHMLTISYLPRLLRFLRERRADTAFRIRSRNREECVAQFARGEADILLCCEAAFTTGVKEMTLSGMGIAWLPQRLIENELNAGTLVSLQQKLGGARLTIALHRIRHQLLPPFEDIWRLLEREAPPF